VLEAVLTAAILAAVLRSQPHLLGHVAGTTQSRRRQLAYAAVSLAAVLALVAVYGASSRPDALEAAGRRLGIADTVGSYLSGPFADYTAPFGGPWVAALAGIIAVFALGFGVSRVLGKGHRNE